MSDVIKIVVAVGILLTYGLQLTVTADLTWQGLRSKLPTKFKKSEANNDADDDEYSPKFIAYYYIMRLSLILGTGMIYEHIPIIVIQNRA